MNKKVWTTDVAVSLLLALALTGCGGKSTTNVTLGGSVTGLTSGSITLSNGNNAIVINGDPNAASLPFTIQAQLPVGVGYNVFVSTPSPSFNCTIANGAGVAGTSDINTIAVTCVQNHKVGGTITGLVADGLQLANGGDVLVVPAGASGFTFTNLVATGRTYGVTILKPPATGTCIVNNGAGYIAATDIATVQVVCN